MHYVAATKVSKNDAQTHARISLVYAHDFSNSMYSDDEEVSSAVLRALQNSQSVVVLAARS